jgi:hypothetical protein
LTKKDDIAEHIVREKPGIITRDLMRLVKARAGVADDNAKTIIARLVDQGRVRSQQDGKPVRHYVVERPEPTPMPTNGMATDHEAAQALIREMENL